MRHITKVGTKHEQEGLKATQEYIDSHWIEKDGRYSNLCYSQSGMSALRQVLLDEQKDRQGYSYCCYCMRRLFLEGDGNGHKANVTLEHIIPHRIKETQWEIHKKQYLEFPNLQDDKVTICYGGKLTSDQAAKRVMCAPYPHFISYHNLVASCDGKIFEDEKPKKSCCCNNGRGDKFVMPIYLSLNLCNEVSYGTDGRLYYDDPDFDDVWFEKGCLNLNAAWLVQVRQIWFQLAMSEYTEADVEKACQDAELRQNIIDDIDEENIIAAWSTQKDIWILFSEYVWFYKYYKSGSQGGGSAKHEIKRG